MTGAGVHIVFYLNVFLLTGVALRHFFKRLSSFVPYTVLLMLIGVLLGVAARPVVSLVLEAGSGAAESADSSRRALAASSSSTSASGSSAGSASGSSGGSGWAITSAGVDFNAVMSMFASIDPHTMLYIFLPALLFESAQVCVCVCAAEEAEWQRCLRACMLSSHTFTFAFCVCACVCLCLRSYLPLCALCASACLGRR